MSMSMSMCDVGEAGQESTPAAGVTRDFELHLVPQLARRYPKLMDHKGSTHWALVATHLPGRTGRECRERWGRLAAGAAGAEQPSRGAADAAASSSSSVAAGAS